MRHLHVILFTAFALSGCGGSSTDEDQRDPRWGTYVANRPGADPVELWEGQDGSKFQIRSAFLDCLEDPAVGRDTFNWEYVSPEGVTLASGQWMISGTRCELIGANSLSFTYNATGETIQTSGETWSGGCFSFLKRLPSDDVWAAVSPGIAFGQLPEDLTLPDPMPEWTYEDLFGC